MTRSRKGLKLRKAERSEFATLGRGADGLPGRHLGKIPGGSEARVERAASGVGRRGCVHDSEIFWKYSTRKLVTAAATRGLPEKASRPLSLKSQRRGHSPWLFQDVLQRLAEDVTLGDEISAWILTPRMETGYKRILLGLGGTAGDRSCATLAFALAKRLRADLQAWLIRPESEDPAVLTASGYTGKAFRSLASGVEAHAREIEAIARTAFEASQGKHTTVSAEFRVLEGGRLHLLVEAVRIVDLAVLPHPQLMPVRYYRHAVEHLVTFSGRPVMLLPARLPADITGHVVLLWKDDARAATALSLCRPLLRLARRVTVLAITEPDQSAGFPDQAKEYLAAHGVQATAVSRSRAGQRVDEAIDAQAEDLGATLLIAGATLNGRIREWLHTSVTGHVLYDLRLPIVLVG